MYPKPTVTCGNGETSSYPGWIKSPHVVTHGIMKPPGGWGWGGMEGVLSAKSKLKVPRSA